MHSVFIDTGLVLGLAIFFSFLAQVLRQPLIVSYIVTGIFAGPVFFNLINSNEEFFDVLAQFGVILLLFLVGLSINVNFLKKVGKTAVIIGLAQVVLTSFTAWISVVSLGFDSVSALYLAIAVSFSSTIIVIKLLGEKKDLRSVYGRYTIGILLVQDMIAILIMILFPAFSGDDSLLVSLLLVFIKTGILLLLVYFLSGHIIPAVLDRVARDGEFLFIFSLAWCFFMAGVGEWSGLSLEVGAIIAGLSLGSTAYQIEISSRLKPLRDFFIVLFFVLLGSEINFDNISSSIFAGLALTLFVIVSKPLFLYFLYRIGHFTRRNSFLSALNSAQVSEFGFVLLFMAKEKGQIDSSAMAVFTIVALLSIFISSYLIKYNLSLYKRAKKILDYLGKDERKAEKEEKDDYDVLVFGYHRLGWKICETLSEMKIKYAVVDFDTHALHKLKQRKIPYFFGDLMDSEFLEELPFAEAKMIISTLPKAGDQILLTKHIRKINKKAIIICNLSHSRYLENLYNAGANYVMMPHLLSGEWISHILKTKKWDKRTFSALVRSQKKEMKLRYSLGA